MGKSSVPPEAVSFDPIIHMPNTAVRGPILIPRDDGRVLFIRDGILGGDERGLISFVGPYDSFLVSHHASAPVRKSDGIITPPFLDAHIHIPQHPIRGRFMDGVESHPDVGRLIAGLNRNVFPAEARCADEAIAREITREFLEDTLAHGVVGGAAYMTVHAPATRVALEILPDLWHVGMVLMNQNCPDYLRTDEPTMERDTLELHRRFGRRVIITDRFAVSVDTQLRQRAVAIARELGLRMQTHLNEQRREKRLVERELYLDAGSYTNVYDRDGLLARDAMVAHCVQMRDEEWDLLARRGARVNHCPISNTLLGSGVMNLDSLASRGIDYAICTDVGASPTTSLLVEMSQFLKIHRGRLDRATPSEALFRTTLAAARMLHVDDQVGRLEVGRPMSFLEISCNPAALRFTDVNEVILAGLFESSFPDLDELTQRAEFRRALHELTRNGLDIGPDLACLTHEIDNTVQRLDKKVKRVTRAGKSIWQRAD